MMMINIMKMTTTLTLIMMMMMMMMTMMMMMMMMMMTTTTMTMNAGFNSLKAGFYKKSCKSKQAALKSRGKRVQPRRKVGDNDDDDDDDDDVCLSVSPSTCLSNFCCINIHSTLMIIANHKPSSIYGRLISHRGKVFL